MATLLVLEKEGKSGYFKNVCRWLRQVAGEGPYQLYFNGGCCEIRRGKKNLLFGLVQRVQEEAFWSGAISILFIYSLKIQLNEFQFSTFSPLLCHFYHSTFSIDMYIVRYWRSLHSSRKDHDSNPFGCWEDFFCRKGQKSKSFRGKDCSVKVSLFGWWFRREKYLIGFPLLLLPPTLLFICAPPFFFYSWFA